MFGVAVAEEGDEGEVSADEGCDHGWPECCEGAELLRWPICEGRQGCAVRPVKRRMGGLIGFGRREGGEGERE